ncbi:MAG: DNA translocase FtsK 4TM domain-containing protein, partial [Acidobacteriaceae bacterium]
MKPVRMVLTPTRNRRLNELIGLLVLASAVLLFLSLVSYRPTDPSLNTIGSGPVRNWIGPAGAVLSDLLLQLEGLSAFLLPLLLGGLGWTWMRSRPAGSPGSKAIGILLTLLFAPALFGLLPSHPHLYGLPVAGLTGRLVADFLVRFLNYPGACIVAVTLVAAAVYLSTTFSFNTAREWLGIKLAFFLAWRDRIANWRRQRAQQHELKAAAKLDKIHEKELAKARKAAEKAANAEKSPIPVAAAAAARDDDDPRHRHGGFAETVGSTSAAAASVPAPGLWDQMPRTAAQESAEPAVRGPQLVPPPTKDEAAAVARSAAARTASAAAAPSIGERADTELRTVTVAPKNVSGFRLPPSTLLHRSDDPSPVKEDELRASAQVLVEKCAEFDVLGQVVQINPGPVVTTFEFRPEAGIKSSRVTGLAEDLCLATRAESILIERMAGKSTVGIQVPNHERETIWLRDIIESEN